MPSPFPGMDPYLENSGRWPDFHLRFINYWCEAIADQLPDDYEARIEERISLEGPPETRAWVTIPDVVIVDTDRARVERPSSSRLTTLEPVAVPLPPLAFEDPVERFIQIMKLPERSLVTVLELLSPANKEEPGRSDYAWKRNGFLRGKVNVVELDLLIGGQRLHMGGALPPGHFFALVSRGDGRGSADVYSWTVRDPMPILPVPLAAPDPEIEVDLARIFTTAFERGRYARTMAYDDPLKLPLSDSDRDWARERVRASRPGPPSSG